MFFLAYLPLASASATCGSEDAELTLSTNREPVQAIGTGDWNGDGRLELAIGVPDRRLTGAAADGLGSRSLDLDRGCSASATAITGPSDAVIPL